MLNDLSGSLLVVVFISLVISITLHEAMHAFTGFWLGDDTAQKEGRISLNPIKHIDPYLTILLPLITLVVFKVPLLAAKPVPFNPYRVRFNEFGAALVGIAGPLTNLLLALVGTSVLYVSQNSLNFDLAQAIVIFIQINVGLFVFNMIPLPPLDGSRLLYAFAPESLQNMLAQLEQFGIFIVFGLLLVVPGFSTLLIYLNDLILSFLLT